MDLRLSQELVFPEGRQFLRFRTTQLQGRASFRVKVDGRQLGIFEPSHSPCWLMTSVFSVTAGRHTLMLEGIEPATSSDSKEEHTCLIDSITIPD